MRIRLRHLLLAVPILLLGALAVAWAGIVPIAASSGHWALTGWFLHFTMRQSVATYSAGIDVPDLSAPGLAARGAGHFAGACAPCHGAPGAPRSAVVLSMTPPPPSLPDLIPTWEPQELFWIVQHGVKYSGMPAWPTQDRPDEVWSVVAFLLRLPELDEAGYERLAFGEGVELAAAPGVADEPGLAGAGEAADPARAGCARCHGLDGGSRVAGAFPLIGGQNEAYLKSSLAAYLDGRRASGIMQAAAARLDPAEIAALARHYAEQPEARSEAADETSAALLARGREIATRGLPAAGVPACRSCHGPPTRYEHYPKIAGQAEWYLAQQLELFHQGRRGGSAYGHIMTAVAKGLEPADIRAVAHFYAHDVAAAAAAAAR